ncbi:MAG: isoaspartyl peptidase/L-asparaginase, partial [Gammaproteobacteria bacterium]
MDKPIAIVLHGGAGWFANLSDEQQTAIKDKMSEALQAGYEVLSSGGTSTDAVVVSISILEDSPLFNAGKGAVFTSEVTQEMDASIMQGNNHAAGAVASVSVVKNPIKLAKHIMENTPHVMFAGEGAEALAKSGGLEIVDPGYFYTQEKFEALQRAQADANSKQDKLGTVGAVALDQFGNLAAGTSTGGMTNKLPGRVGDSPIIGAGTWADNESCGVSATGHGEFFIRYNVAKEICDRVKYLGQSIESASKKVIEELKEIDADGGVIVLNRRGQA